MMAKTLPTLRDWRASHWRGQVVLLRLDVNVPLRGSEVASGFRLERSLPTLDYLRKVGAITVIIGHLGRRRQDSLTPVFRYLNRKMHLRWLPTLTDLKVAPAAPEGSVFLLENLRHWPGEANNDLTFAKKLAAHANFYVNDAFASAHRQHASIVTLPKLLPHAAGLGLLSEVEQLSKAFYPPRPTVVILGGAKFATKLPVLRRFLKIADTVFVAGALAHSFFKAEGLVIGRSLVDQDLNLVKPFLNQTKIQLPSDVVVTGVAGLPATAGPAVKPCAAVGKDETIVDAGPATINQIKQAISAARFVLWNGPLGNFEKGFDLGTKAVAQAIAKSNGYSIVGGGDTVAAIESLDLLKKFDFVSTGGGAMLDFLATGTLPGIEALKLKQPR